MAVMLTRGRVGGRRTAASVPSGSAAQMFSTPDVGLLVWFSPHLQGEASTA